MNTFINKIVKQIKESAEFNALFESIKKYNVYYIGRFQPFHKGHYKSYKELCTKFGESNVYVCTSNNTGEKSPFNFEERKKIIESFGISSSHIKMLSGGKTYSPEGYSVSVTPDTAVIFAVGNKDADRLVNGKYFVKYNGALDSGYEEHGYIYVIKSSSNISGTEVRDAFKNSTDKKKTYEKYIGKFNKSVFDLIVTKLGTVKESKQISEGGAYGHMSHLYEDLNLTFGDLKRIIKMGLSGKLNTATEKCIDGDSVVYLQKSGSTTIRNVVENEIDEKILSFNLETNEYEYKSIINYVKNDNTDTWLKIILHDGDSITVTPNHKIYTKDNGYIPAEELTTDSILYKGLSNVEVNISKVELIQKINNDAPRYDLTIADRACYFANDILIHNTDGQNLMITYKDGAVRAARNKSHLKNNGANSLTIDKIKDMFNGRGEIQNAFVYAMNDMSSSLNAIPQKALESIFKNGKCFLSFEVIYPQTTNVIPYGSNMLIFHDVIEYDINGDAIGQVKSGADKLFAVIKKVNSDVQRTFAIRPKAYISFNSIDNAKQYETQLIGKLNKIQSECMAKDTDKLLYYYEWYWKTYIKQLKVDSQVSDILIQRWVYGNKSTSLTKIKTMCSPEDFEKISITDKSDYTVLVNKFINPIRQIIIDFGVILLSNIKELLAVNPQDALQKMSNALTSSIEDIKKSNDSKVLNKLEFELNKIKAAGGDQAVLPTEGVVFVYKGKIYKLTGTFGAVNSILGMLKY